LSGTIRAAVTLIFSVLIIGQATYNVFHESSSASPSPPSEKRAGRALAIGDILRELMDVPRLIATAVLAFIRFVVRIIQEITSLLHRYIVNWNFLGNLLVDGLCLVGIFGLFWATTVACSDVQLYLMKSVSVKGAAFLVSMHIAGFHSHFGWHFIYARRRST
jgi:hypothetical protein